jgi:transposase
VQADHPGRRIEIWAFDEHRLGLKPILRRVWARRGEQPIAMVCHRYQWLYLNAFVHPQTGATLWFLMPSVRTDIFSQVLAAFAQSVGAGPVKLVVLVVDQAGWHISPEVLVPAGIILLFLPPYSPELQPAERLWALTDEPLVNRAFASLDELETLLCQQCRAL